MLRAINIAGIILFIIFASNISYSKSLDEKMFNAIELLPKPWYPPSHAPKETEEERLDRMAMIARIIVEESSVDSGWYWSDESLAWAVMIKTWFESGRFRYSVHSGKLRGDKGRSVCLGQIMNGSEKLVGVTEENTRNCIRKVIKHLVMHQNRCLNNKSKPTQWNIAIIYAGYGTGHSCNGNISKNINGKKHYWARQRAWAWKKVQTM